MAIDTLDAARSTRRIEALLAAEARAVPPSGAVALFGQSLGGAMALHLAARGRLPSVRAVVALSPFLPLAETYPAALRADGRRPNMTVVRAVDDALVPLALGVFLKNHWGFAIGRPAEGVIPVAHRGRVGSQEKRTHVLF